MLTVQVGVGGAASQTQSGSLGQLTLTHLLLTQFPMEQPAFPQPPWQAAGLVSSQQGTTSVAGFISQFFVVV
jgi:hypothetical protein